MENSDNFDFETWEEELLNETVSYTDTPVEDLPTTEEPAENFSEYKAAETKRKATKWQKNILLYLHDFVSLVAILILVSLLLVRVVVVSGTSMTNTLMNGDYLLVLNNLFYKNPQQGDIIVASKDSFDNGAPIVKRVIATEGQWVDIDFEAGIVYVGPDLEHMQALEEPYTKTATNIQEGVTFPLKVEEGCIFVLGDNRNGSRDSRFPDIGLIHKQEVLGKVVFLFLPGIDQDTEIRDFGRIGVVN